MLESVFTEFSREEEELLAGAPDEFLCPIMSILMTDPVSFIFTRGPECDRQLFSVINGHMYYLWLTGPGVKSGHLHCTRNV